MAAADHVAGLFPGNRIGHFEPTAPKKHPKKKHSKKEQTGHIYA
jgi:hypothetical protein